MVGFLIVQDPLLGTISNICALAVVIIGVVLDETQAIYLAYAIFSKKKNKYHISVLTALQYTIVANCVLILLDWVGITLELYQIIYLHAPKDPLSLNVAREMQQISVAIGSMHFSISVYIFYRMKKLTFSGTKTERKVKQKQIIVGTVQLGSRDFNNTKEAVQETTKDTLKIDRIECVK